jgi:hypothetical protein
MNERLSNLKTQWNSWSQSYKWLDLFHPFLDWKYCCECHVCINYNDLTIDFTLRCLYVNKTPHLIKIGLLYSHLCC